MEHIIRAQQFTPVFIKKIFRTADRFEKSRGAPLKGKILASLFYEPSTRTRFSFEAAMLRLGGAAMSTENAREFSSAAKGETLEDTIRVISSYANVIVLRHHEEGAALRAARVSSVPIINAGDGAGQHPTQALLDLYTIERELKKTSGITVAMVGDLKHGRTVRSLAYLLGKYKNNKIIFVSTRELRIGRDILAYLRRHRVAFEETEALASAVRAAHVLYITRTQKERFPKTDDYERLKGKYRITPAVVGTMRRGAIVMHPLPRVDEITPEVDALPQAAYFREARYGLFIRMALLEHLLKSQS